MGELRIVAMLGPAAVLYLLADAASRQGRLAPVQIVLGVVALVLSIGPRYVQGRIAAREPGARRVAWLGTLGGLAIASRVSFAAAPDLVSPVASVFGALTSAAMGGLALDLACTVPDAPRGLARIRGALIAGGVVAAALGVLVGLPPLPFAWMPVLSPRLALAPWAFLVFALLLALVLRLLRERLGSAPAALASNAWAMLGLVPALLAGALAVVAHSAGFHGLAVRWDGFACALTAASLLYGHVALVEPARRIEAAGFARQMLEWTFAGAAIAAIAGAVALRVPRDPLSSALIAILLLAVATVVRRTVRPIVRRLLAPFGGRLLDALALATEAIGTTSSIETFAEALLGPLRAAAGDADADPRLVLTDPEIAVRLDLAGVAHSRKETSSPPLVRHFVQNPGAIVTHAELDAQVVRRPELRPMHELLTLLDALVAVPVVSAGELEAVLVVARGRRTTPPSLEELASLERFAARIAPQMAMLTAHVRAEARVGKLAFERDRADERAETLDDEVRRLRTEVRVLRQGRGSTGRGATVVAYSAAGRDLERAIADVAPTLSPVTLVSEPGMHVDRIAARIHAGSGVAEGPFVLADCAALLDDEVDRAFFGVDGDAGAPGFLRLADGGTLLLADVAALPMPTQRALAEALSARGARAVGSHGIYGFDVRILAASRLPIEWLVERGALDTELGRWLAQAQLRVPPLRERREDLPSLALLAVDRAARRLGRASLGIDQAALEHLVSYAWPGNVRELELVLDLAVEQTEGEVVLGDTVGALLAQGAEPAAPTGAEAKPDTLDGSLVDIERRALVRALEGANGNKSEAARALGLKRTTFLDKLRRFGLDDASQPTPGGEAS